VAAAGEPEIPSDFTEGGAAEVLKDLTRSDWLNILGLPASRVPAVLIVRGTRNFRSKYRAMLPCFDNVLELGTPNGIIEDVLIGDVAGRPVGFACVYGASMASEVVHIFGALGTRAAIQIGNCGALADGLGAGDLFVADRAYCGEGAARYYKPDGAWVAASANLLRSRTLSALPPGECRGGAIYTTAALFAEGEDDVERWFREGFAAVDMETAATYAVAEHFGMDRVAILYGFDNPRRREHLLLGDAEKDIRRAAGNERMRQLALDLAAEVGAGGTPGAAPAPTGPHVRDCRPEDVEAILALWRQAGTTVTVTDTPVDLRRAITDITAVVLVAERGGRVAGSVIGSFDGWRGNVYRLAVHPGYRRQGIARTLVAELERRLTDQGAKRVTALVLKDDAGATAFWAAAGYKPDSRMARFVRDLDGGRQTESSPDGGP
jgi:ribosomal protein S18 acetylase RimI-like enzyme/purine-nucleoside phosphorylase